MLRKTLLISLTLILMVAVVGCDQEPVEEEMEIIEARIELEERYEGVHPELILDANVEGDSEVISQADYIWKVDGEKVGETHQIFLEDVRSEQPEVELKVVAGNSVATAHREHELKNQNIRANFEIMEKENELKVQEDLKVFGYDGIEEIEWEAESAIQQESFTGKNFTLDEDQGWEIGIRVHSGSGSAYSKIEYYCPGVEYETLTDSGSSHKFQATVPLDVGWFTWRVDGETIERNGNRNFEYESDKSGVKSVEVSVWTENGSHIESYDRLVYFE